MFRKSTGVMWLVELKGILNVLQTCEYQIDPKQTIVDLLKDYRPMDSYKKPIVTVGIFWQKNCFYNHEQKKRPPIF